MGKSKIGLIKHTFFNHSSKQNNFSFKEEDFSLDKLRAEFFSLYQVFLSNKSTWSKDNLTVLYMSYLCDLLILYYQQDYVSSDLQKIKQIRKEIMIFWGNEQVSPEQKSCNEFPDFILERLRTNTQDYISSLSSISKIRTYIGTLNTNRSQFSYGRNLAMQAIFYIQKSFIADFFQEINKVLGNQFSFNESIKFFNESREAITDLGIALYALRFAINLVLVAKHIIQSAFSEELSVKKVLNQEMAKRGFTMASDFVWATVSLLTTYNNYFHIASSIVSPLILSFLTFDTLLLFAQWLFEANKYQEQVQELKAQQADATELERGVIQRQIDILNDEWEAQCSYFTINIIGANILATCFAISMLSTGPFVLAGVAFFSMLGNALYNTSEEYKKYQKSQIALRRELDNGKILDDAHHQELVKVLNEECNQRYMQFWNNLAFNAGGIAIIITAAAASWPIALGLTLLYASYRLNDAYQKDLDKNNKEGSSHDIYRLFNSEKLEVPALELSSVANFTSTTQAYNITETPKLI